jgi:hypothetical protein
MAQALALTATRTIAKLARRLLQRMAFLSYFDVE